MDAHPHDYVIKRKHLPRYWPSVRGIHRSPVNSPHKGQWRGALMFSLIWTWINGWVNNGEAGDFRCHRAHYDVTVMSDTPVFYIAYFNKIYSKFLVFLIIPLYTCTIFIQLEYHTATQRAHSWNDVIIVYYLLSTYCDIRLKMGHLKSRTPEAMSSRRMNNSI